MKAANPQDNQPHIPVMLAEVLHALALKEGNKIIDATFGAGGYSQAILDAGNHQVIAVDRDPSVLPRATQFQQQYRPRFRFYQGRFGDLSALMESESLVDGIVLDIGVSSMQLDEAMRGFSFRFDAPLDMRMSQEGRSAADIINQTGEKDLADILWQYGEEKASRRIAAAIIRERAIEPITTTARLRDIIHQVIPPRAKDRIDPATRTFQALRIAVNEELEELKRALHGSISLLREGGRLVVVTFHSLEDRIVKQWMRAVSEQDIAISRHLPSLPAISAHEPLFRLAHSKAIQASEEEISRNPRARSAKLRTAIRTSTSAIPGAIAHA